MSLSTGSSQSWRIGIVVPSLGGGGAEFVAGEWARYLNGVGHSATLITTHDRCTSSPEVPVVSLEAANFPARVRALRRHVAASSYDVLLGLMPHWNILVLLAALGRFGSAPAVLISGRNVEAPLRRVHGWQYRAELALCKLLYRRADGYVAISHSVAAEAAATYGLDPSRVWVVPNPATAKVTGSPIRSHASRTRPHSHSSVTLTVPARLVPQKQPAVAVETAAILRSQWGIAASVDYFGTGPERFAVQAAADRLHIPIRFRGWVSAWFDEVADDAVVLLPSVAEGFANVLVEAAAAGIPSVTSSRALGVADAVIPNVTGILALDTAPESLAEAVGSAMNLTPTVAGPWFDRFSPEESGRKLVRVMAAALQQARAGVDKIDGGSLAPTAAGQRDVQ